MIADNIKLGRLIVNRGAYIGFVVANVSRNKLRVLISGSVIIFYPLFVSGVEQTRHCSKKLLTIMLSHHRCVRKPGAIAKMTPTAVSHLPLLSTRQKTETKAQKTARAACLPGFCGLAFASRRKTRLRAAGFPAGP